jgi:LPXTG-site transpeptidase (sortase) family protein
LPAWLTFTDNSDGTATLSGTPPLGSGGTYSFTFTASNSIPLQVTQNFTLTVAGGPVVPEGGINSTPDTGNGSISEFEIVTVGITQLIVRFNQDVLNLPSTDPNYIESVINPANYLLVRDNGDGFQTTSCGGEGGGVAATDTAITVDSVTYDKEDADGLYVATLHINSGLPLPNGIYRLFVCGSTSITNLAGIKLAGNGTLEGTDFVRNFTVQLPGTGGGGAGGVGGASSKGNNNISSNFNGLLIPVTGFAPDQSTQLPAQPEDSAYSSTDGLRIVIPAIGVNVPIVGVPFTNNNWDLTWLGANAGYLDGSSYPTWSGNSVLTGHDVDATGAPGVFAYIKDLQIGDKIFVHLDGQVFVYEVRENQKVLPTDLATIFKHEAYSWLTLVTCEDYNKTTKSYDHRRYARAVLISVIPEKQK